MAFLSNDRIDRLERLLHEALAEQRTLQAQIDVLAAEVRLRNSQWDNVAEKLDLTVQLIAGIAVELRKAREAREAKDRNTIMLPMQDGTM